MSTGDGRETCRYLSAEEMQLGVVQGVRVRRKFVLWFDVSAYLPSAYPERRVWNFFSFRNNLILLCH